MGGAFAAVITVENGKVVDGLGGTSGPLGYLALGAMDGELAYLLGGFHKELLCSGGMAYIAGHPDLAPEEILAHTRTDTRCSLAWETFLESLVKCVAAEMSIVSSPREILISGRLCRTPEISEEVTHRLSCLRRSAGGGLRPCGQRGGTRAALIAEGLAGGVHERMIEIMGLRDAAGTSLDHLYVDGADTLRGKYLRLKHPDENLGPD